MTCKRAFTLVEVLLSLVIAMIVLSAIAMVYFNFATGWVANRESQLIEQHNDSVFAFLESEFRKINAIKSENDRFYAIEWRQLPGEGSNSPFILSWLRDEPLPFAYLDNAYQRFDVRIFLQHNDFDGLTIIWHPEDPMINQLDDFFEFVPEENLYYFPLSIDITAIRLGYYDAEEDYWEFLRYDEVDPNIVTDTDINTVTSGLPDIIRWQFDDVNETVRSIYLRDSAAGESGPSVPEETEPVDETPQA